jgi:hypothetical protein
LWSHHDITGPVKDENGAVVLTEEDFKDGLFDKDRKHVKISKIKQVRNNVFRRGNELYQQYASKHVNKAKDATLNWMSKVGERRVGMNYDDNPIDVYVKGEKNPRVTAVQFKKAVVIDRVSGKPIKSHTGIAGDVSLFENGVTNKHEEYTVRGVEYTQGDKTIYYVYNTTNNTASWDATAAEYAALAGKEITVK